MKKPMPSKMSPKAPMPRAVSNMPTMPRMSGGAGEMSGQGLVEALRKIAAKNPKRTGS